MIQWLYNLLYSKKDKEIKSLNTRIGIMSVKIMELENDNTEVQKWKK